MHMLAPQETEVGRGLDSLKEMNQEHEDLVRWMSFLEAALDEMDRDDGWARVRIVELFLSGSLLRHLAFEERAVFPSLAAQELDPVLNRRLVELVEEHKEIRLAVGRFSLLTQDYAEPPPESHRTSIQRHGMAVRELLLNHASRESAVLMPVIRRAEPPRIDLSGLDPLPW